jgi:hypothetical protein
MNWCCVVFQGWCQQAGQRGVALFVSTRESADPAFILQYRALDPDAPIPRTNSPLSSVSDVQIHYCPWCGADLKKTYRTTFRELDRSELQVPLREK